MANFDINTNESASAIAPSPCHEKFSWFASNVPPSALKDLTGQVFDICAGAQVALEIVQKNHMYENTGDQMLISLNEAERLVLFTTAALGLLKQVAWDRIEQMNESALQGAKA